MQAIPDLGYQFSDWQPVDIFFFIQQVPTGGGITNTVVTEVQSPLPEYSDQSILDFTMQPGTVITSTENLEVTQSEGWQADFTPTPEPSTIFLMTGGLMAVVLVRHARFRRDRDLPL
jgi:hypothetical protein